MVKRNIDFNEAIRTNFSVQDFSEMEKFKLDDDEIRGVYPKITDNELGVLKEKLVEFTKIIYSINNNN